MLCSEVHTHTMSKRIAHVMTIVQLSVERTIESCLGKHKMRVVFLLLKLFTIVCCSANGSSKWKKKEKQYSRLCCCCCCIRCFAEHPCVAKNKWSIAFAQIVAIKLHWTNCNLWIETKWTTLYLRLRSKCDLSNVPVYLLSSLSNIFIQWLKLWIDFITSHKSIWYPIFVTQCFVRIASAWSLKIKHVCALSAHTNRMSDLEQQKKTTTDI